MRVAKAAAVALAGVAIGLVLGYALWDLQATALTLRLGKTDTELLKTRRWLGDEIHWSDERHAQVEARLTRALADLARARAQLAHVTAASRSSPTAGDAPAALPAQATESHAAPAEKSGGRPGWTVE